MDYEKKYKESLELARDYYKANLKLDKADENLVLEDIFPELKESEDEKIRKALLEMVHDTTGDELWVNYNVHKEEALAWLEKQGEQKSFDYENANIQQKDFAPQVESKFKDGDWIISNNKKSTYQVIEVKRGIYVIRDNADNHEYHIGIEECEKSGRLWTIQDAKDGDVLCYKDEISLYKHDIKNCTKQEITFGGFVYHCCYDGKKFITDSLYSLTEQDKIDIHLATKEQRDLLFQKMKDAGYEWDAEKKELKKISQRTISAEAKEAMYDKPKWNVSDFRTWQYIVSDVLTKKDGIGQYLDSGECKKIAKYMQEEWSKKLNIEQKPTWSEEDETRLQVCIDCLQAKSLMGKVDTVMTNWLKSLKERVQPKQEWSEEDKLVVEDIEEAVINYWHGQSQEDLLDWLKSLKDRVGCEANCTTTWKPSKEQMDVLLSEVTAWTKGCSKQKILESLYNDLNKLKE